MGMGLGPIWANVIWALMVSGPEPKGFCVLSEKMYFGKQKEENVFVQEGLSWRAPEVEPSGSILC